MKISISSRRTRRTPWTPRTTPVGPPPHSAPAETVRRGRRGRELVRARGRETTFARKTPLFAAGDWRTQDARRAHEVFRKTCIGKRPIGRVSWLCAHTRRGIAVCDSFERGWWDLWFSFHIRDAYDAASRAPLFVFFFLLKKKACHGKSANRNHALLRVLRLAFFLPPPSRPVDCAPQSARMTLMTTWSCHTHLVQSAVVLSAMLPKGRRVATWKAMVCLEKASSVAPRT